MRNQLISIFDGVKDPRKVDKCTYELGDLMAIALLTYLTGKKDYADMALFAKNCKGYRRQTQRAEETDPGFP